MRDQRRQVDLRFGRAPQSTWKINRSSSITVGLVERLWIAACLGVLLCVGQMPKGTQAFNAPFPQRSLLGGAGESLLLLPQTLTAESRRPAF